MAEYRTFDTANQPILLEVSGGGGGRSGSLVDLFSAVADVAASYADAMAAISKQQQPTQSTVAFGLRALEDGSLAVAHGTEGASFAVTITWSAPAALPARPTKPAAPTEPAA